MTDNATTRKLNSAKERGAASLKIVLHNGAISVFHGTDKALLAELQDAPEGTWDALWDAMTSLGIERRFK